MKIPTIEIKIRTNIAGENSAVALTNAMFFQAPPKKKTEDPPRPLEPPTSNYPYFRVDVAFTPDMLNGTTAYEFFFNRTAFIVGVGAAKKIDVTDPRKVQKTARENVIFMLKSLFTTSYPIEDNLENSFDANIQQTTTQVGRRFGIIPELFAFLFPSTTSQYTYLALNGSQYTVLGVMWINDVVNHSRYRELMKSVVAYMKSKKKKVVLIEKQLKELASQFTKENLTELVTFLNTQIKKSSTDSDDVGVKPIQTWLDQNPLNNKEFIQAFKLKKEEDKIQLLAKYVAPYLNEFYIQQMIINELIESRRPAKTESKRLTEFQNDPNFRELVKLSREFNTRTKLKSFFTGKEPEPKLLTPVYTKTETSLTEFQSALTEDSEFCDMMNKLLEVVPDNTLELPKNSSAEYNPILKKLKSPDAATRVLLTTNNNLQQAIQDYLKKGCTDNSFETFASQLETLYFNQEEEAVDSQKLKTKETPQVSWMTTDVVQQSKEMFAIEVQLELMQGLLDDTIKEKIVCSFGDKRLQTQYDRLKRKLDDRPLYLQAPAALFSIDSFLPKEKVVEKVAAKKTGGTRHRRQRRSSMTNRRRN